MLLFEIMVGRFYVGASGEAGNVREGELGAWVDPVREGRVAELVRRAFDVRRFVELHEIIGRIQRRQLVLIGDEAIDDARQPLRRAVEIGGQGAGVDEGKGQRESFSVRGTGPGA
jgi:hypothetical protein